MLVKTELIVEARYRPAHVAVGWNCVMILQRDKIDVKSGIRY